MNVEGFSLLVLWQQIGFTITEAIRVWTSLCFLDMWIIPDSGASNDWKIKCVAQKPHTRWCLVFVYGRVWLNKHSLSHLLSLATSLCHLLPHYLVPFCVRHGEQRLAGAGHLLWGGGGEPQLRRRGQQLLLQQGAPEWGRPTGNHLFIASVDLTRAVLSSQVNP